MLSKLASDTGFSFYELTSNTTVLNTGIYYMTESLTFNAGKNSKNGLAVASGATAYLYIPAGVTLKVYGGDGTDANNGSDVTVKKANPGETPVARFDEYPYTFPIGGVTHYLNWWIPFEVKDSEAGTPGNAAEGGGAAIYVPHDAKLVVLGSGELIAQGGNGGDASQGALGMSSTYWWMSGMGGIISDGEPHFYCNNTAWNDIRIESDYGYVKGNTPSGWGAQAGAGGTGGSGAGGGGAAIGTNGGTGTSGALGGTGTGLTDATSSTVKESDYIAPLIKGEKKLKETPAETAGEIYIAGVSVTATAGTGGDACEKKDTEKWNNGTATEGKISVESTETRFEVQMTSHAVRGFKKSYTSGDDYQIPIFVTNARMGGNGGAGGKGAAIGNGGAGGAGGGGGDSGSIVFPGLYAANSKMNNYYDEIYGETIEAGDDGVAGADSTDVNTTLAAENYPYNILTFTDNGSKVATRNYYLLSSTTITMPDSTGVTVPYGKQFVGWKITKAANALNTFGNNVFGENPCDLVNAYSDANKKIYKANETITATGIYGNVTLEAVLENKPTNPINFAQYKESIKDAGEWNYDISAAWDGEKVKLEATDRTSAGYKFTGFTVTQDDAAKTPVAVGELDLTNRTAAFTMPAVSVTVTANYAPIDYTVTVTDGTASNSTNAGAAGSTLTGVHVGDTITLTPNSHSAQGEDFDKWTLTPGTVTVVTAADGTGTFDMPADNVTAKAEYKLHNYTITALTTDCTFTVTGNGGAAQVQNTAQKGNIVTLTARDRTSEGYGFTGFTVKTTSDGSVYKEIAATAGVFVDTFTMPADNVTVTANYKPMFYNVTAKDCQVDNTQPNVGDTVKVSAPTDYMESAGKKFVGYTVTATQPDGSVGPTYTTITPDSSNKGTFVMPAYAVTVTANYDWYDFAIASTDGTKAADQNGADVATAHMGDTITLTAGTIPEGEHFTGFKVTKTGTAETVKVSKVDDTYQFTMPAHDVTIETLHDASDFGVTATDCSITVTNAQGATTTSDSATAQKGNQIVVKAPAPQTGEKFTGFTVKNSKNEDVVPTGHDDDARTVTFEMPADNVTVTANYEKCEYEIDVADSSISITGNDGATSANGKPTATYGTKIYLTQDGTASEGQEFTEFVVKDAGGNTVGLHTADGNVYFEMPASNVTVTANYGAKHYAIKVNNGTFTVDGDPDKTTATKDQTITLHPDDRTDEGLEFDEWTVVKGDIAIVNDQFTMPAGEVEVTAKYKKIGYGIDADNTSVTVKDANGSEKTGEPNAGDKVEIVADDLTDEGYDFIDFTVTKKSGGNVDLTQWTNERKGSFTMPVGGVDVKANYKKIPYIVSVGSRGSFTLTPAEDSTTQGGSYTGPTNAQVKDSIVFTTDGPGEDECFAGWTFTVGGQAVKWADVQQYVQTGDENSLTITISMPPKNLTATPVYKPIIGYDIVFEDGCGFARVEGQITTAANENDEVTIRAAAEEGLLFDYWEMFYGTDPDAEDWKDITDQLASKTSAETTFIMPDGPVTLRAHYIPASADPGTDMISKGEAAGKSVAAAAAAVGVGIAVWQGSELAMRIYRNKIIQIDYWPGNRISLAQLIWSRAGMPEPENTALYDDITEAYIALGEDETSAQKAARWCVEQGLLDAKVSDDGTESFEPMKHVTHLRVCLTWENARKMGFFEVPVETE